MAIKEKKPRKILSLFFDYMFKEDYVSASKYVQKTWRIKPNYVQRLQALAHVLNMFDVKSVKIIEKIKPSILKKNIFSNNIIIFKIKLGDNDYTINLIRESKAFNPDLMGEYGVNPESLNQFIN